MPDSAEIVRAIIERSDWRRDLAAQEEDAARRLTAAYGRILPRIQQVQNDLTDAMHMEVKGGEVVTPGMVRGLQEYSRLLTTIEAELGDFSVILGDEMGGLSEGAIESGLAAGQTMAAGLSPANAAIINDVWLRPDPAMIRQIVNYMDSDGMRVALGGFGDNAARDIADLIIGLAAQGKNPRLIARMMADWNSVPYSWADNMTRTVQIWSARTASHAGYVANQDVLDGWMWVSAADGRTCISCWSQHGKIFGFDQMLNDHHRGRCTAVPVVRGTTWRDSFTGGPDLFGTLDESEQRGIMGNEMWDAWRSGEVGWGDFSVPYENDIYGEMLRAASLIGIRRGR